MTRPSSTALAYSAAIVVLAATLGWVGVTRIVRQSETSAALASAANYAVVPRALPSGAMSVDTQRYRDVARSYGKLPLSFEPNYGQTGRRAQFIAHGPGQALFLGSSEAVLVLRAPTLVARQGDPGRAQDITALGTLLPTAFREEDSPDANRHASAMAESVLKMRLLGAIPGVRGVGVAELPGKANYFTGNNPANWITGVRTYSKVRFPSVYSGIDVVYYGNSQQLEYDFVVSPRSDPRQIALGFEGADRVSVDEATGDLLLSVEDQQIRLHKPVAYQTDRAYGSDLGRDKNQFVNVGYRVEKNARVTFEVASYDTARPLVIDPALSYFTYLGGILPDFALRIAVDSSGNAYVTGATVSPNFPTSSGALRTSLLIGICSHRTSFDNLRQFPCPDAFVTKLNSTGTAALYSTFLGGTRSDLGIGIAVDSNGDAYVVGETESPDFPVTSTAFQTTLLSSGPGIHTSSAFLTKLSATGSQILYSTYLGATSPLGTSDSFATAVAADNSGNAFVAGYTRSESFPTTPGVVQPLLNGITCNNLFVYGGGINFPAAGFAGSVYVGAPASCNWTATSNASWLTITSGGGGSGNGTVNISIATNSGAARVGSITVAGRDITIGQLGVSTCTSGITLSPQGAGLGAAGSTVSVNVPAPTGCSWSAASNVSWITITSGSSGSGNGTVGISVSPNPGIPFRSAVIIIGDQFFYINQNGICNYLGCSDGFVSKLNTSASGNASLVYSTYLGGNNFDVATGVAVDAGGNAYVSGTTLSSNFLTLNAFQPAPAGGKCGPPWLHTCASAFLTKLNPAATALLFSTYLGGSADNGATAIALDSIANVYVTGLTNSADFPVTAGAAQPSHAAASCFFGAVFVECPDAFVAKFSSSGSTIYSTYLGGTGADLGLSIAADSQGDAFVTGTTNSTNFPTASPVQANPGGGNCSFRSVGGAPLSFTCPDVFVSELNPAGTALLFSTYLGGNSADIGTGIALDTSTNPNGILATGATLSPGLATPGVLQSTPGGMGDAFVAKITTAQADFSISAASGGSTSATVNAGQTATYNLQVTPSGGFIGSVSVACTGAPTPATCTPSASSVNVTGASSIPFSVTVQTIARGLLPQSPVNHPTPPVWYVLLVLLASFLAIVYRVDRASRLEKRRYAWAFAGVMLACLASLAPGCGGGGGGGGGGNNGTPAGTYTLTVTGTNQGTNHSLSLKLTVN